MAAATSTGSYSEALARLSLLQSNRAITSLFDSSPTKPPAATADLNALAIPEMLAWLRRAGYTPASLADSGLRCVHVAGTKGKGSVSTLVASILAQYPICQPVGTYTSPHLVSVRERILINGQPISQGLFAQYFFEVWDALTEAARTAGDVVPDGEGGVDGPATKPFYFRFLTILALHVFVREGVKDAVVECGIGGEYDATNVLDEQTVSAAVVTQLGLDHVAMLGDTVEKIAWNKAGVWKKGVRGFTRRLDGREGVMHVLRERAGEKGAELVEIGDEAVDGWEGVQGARLQGPFQKYNMVLAVAAARDHLIKRGVKFEGEFGREGYPLGSMPEEFKRGLREAALRGRCEVFEDEHRVQWFIDGAHTEDSLGGVGAWFADEVKSENAVRILLFNQQERDVATLLGALLTPAGQILGQTPAFTHAIFSRNEEQPRKQDEPGRDLSVQTRASEVLRSFGDTPVFVQDSVQSSVRKIREIAAEAKREGKGCKVLATGSFHLIGAVLRTIDHVEY